MNPHIKQALLWLVTIALLGGCVYALYATGFFQTLHSRSAMEAYIAQFSPWSHLMYFVIQLVSVIVAPIPSNITSRDKPAAFRNSGEIRIRPAESISTSDALPRKIRCQTRADIGQAAIFSR